MPSLDKKLLLDSTRYIDSWLDYRYKDSHIPGFAVAIQSGSKTLLSKGYGFANLEKQERMTSKHYFRIASHSKIFTATAIMLLAEKGLLRLDDKVSDHLPWFKSQKDKTVAKITIRQLLSHSSGLIRDGEQADYWALDADFPTERQLRQYVKSTRCIYPNNEKFKYSNYGYSYLGALIAKVSGKPYNQFVQEAIVDKLKLKDTAPELDERAEKRLATGYSLDMQKIGRRSFPNVSTNGMSAATGFYSTVGDMSRFARAHYLGNEELLSDDSKREMQRLQWHVDNDEEDYGLGMHILTVGERKLVGHGGGFPGFITSTQIDSKNQLVITVYTNSLDGQAPRIAKSIIAMINFFQEQGRMPSDKKLNPASFAGRFFCRWGATDIVQVGQKLFAIYPNSWNSPFEFKNTLEYQSKDKLKITDANGYESPGETVSYYRDSRGKTKYINYAGSKMWPWSAYRKTLRPKNNVESPL